tara:strand:+ start:7082 stop:7294 length:213 start_codon:yes stop_codon:yes gene_type:complete
MLEEVGSEMESRKDRCFVTRAEEGAAKLFVVLAIKTWQTKVVVDGVHFESRKWAEMIFAVSPTIQFRSVL